MYKYKFQFQVWRPINAAMQTCYRLVRTQRMPTQVKLNNSSPLTGMQVNGLNLPVQRGDVLGFLVSGDIPHMSQEFSITIIGVGTSHEWCDYPYDAMSEADPTVLCIHGNSANCTLVNSTPQRLRVFLGKDTSY